MKKSSISTAQDLGRYYPRPVCTLDEDVSSTSAVPQIEKRLNIQFTPSKFGGGKAVEARERFVWKGVVHVRMVPAFLLSRK